MANSEIKKVVVDGIEFIFMNSFRGNRNGFVHECSLYGETRQIAFAKAQYYNRTWESYTYQSVMMQAVESAIAQPEYDAIEAYKKSTGKKRIPKEVRDKITSEDKSCQLYRKLLAQL